MSQYLQIRSKDALKCLIQEKSEDGTLLEFIQQEVENAYHAGFIQLNGTDHTQARPLDLEEALKHRQTWVNAGELQGLQAIVLDNLNKSYRKSQGYD